MIHLFAVLVPIALIDSISPVRFGAMISMLVGDRPFARAWAFLSAIFLGYVALGLGFAFFGQRLLDINLVLNPAPINFVIGGLIGIVLVLIGIRALRARPVEGEVEIDGQKGAVRAFVTGLVITIATIPTAVPLLAGVNRILVSEVGTVQAYGALGFYCAVYLTPLIILMVQRALLGERAEAVMWRIAAGAERWMGLLMAVLFILLGVLNIVDALGFFLFNRPLF